MKKNISVLLCVILSIFTLRAQAESLSLAYPQFTLSGQGNWEFNNGADAPLGGWIGRAVGDVSYQASATVSLGKTITPGRYFIFVDATNYDVPANLVVGLGGGSGAISTNDRDWNLSWTEQIVVDVPTSTNALTLTFTIQPKAKVMFRRVYITDVENRTVSREGRIIDFRYPTEAEMDRTPPQKVNLIENGSFEVGVDAQWGVFTKSTVPLSMWSSGTAKFGSRFLRVPLDPTTTGIKGRGATIMSRIYRLLPNKRYTFSCWAKVEQGGAAPLRLIMENAFDFNTKTPLPSWYQGKPTFTTQGLSVDTTWRQFFITGDAIAYPTSDYIFSINSENAKVGDYLLIDGVQLQEGEITDQTPYAPSREVEVGVVLDRPGKILLTSESPVGTLHVVNHASTSKNKILEYTILSSTGAPVRNGSLSLNIPASSAQATSFSLSTGQLGSFNLLYWLQGENGSDKELAYSILSPPPTTSVTNSNMGVHTNFYDSSFAVASRMGIKWVRALSPGAYFRWQEVEPSKGVFNWSIETDNEVRRANAAGIEILGTITGLNGKWPDFAETGSGVRLSDWHEYVTAVVTHYKSMVHTWEIWNEPFHGFPAPVFTPATYARLLKTAVDAIEAADPTAKIVGIGGEQDNYMVAVINELALQYPGWDVRAHVDVFSAHLYYRGNSPDNLVPTMTPYGIPVWNTESGVYDKGSYLSEVSNFISWGATPYWESQDALRFYRGFSEAPEGLVKTYIPSIAQGLTRYFYYDARTGMDSSSPDFFIDHPTFVHYDGSIKPKGTAYAIAGSLIDGAVGKGKTVVANKVDAYFLQQPTYALATLWTNDSSPQYLQFSSLQGCSISALDMMGNAIPFTNPLPVGRRPVYLKATVCAGSTFKTLFSSATVSARSDNTPPSLSLVSGPRGTILSGAVRFRWQGWDDTSLPLTYVKDPEQHSSVSVADPRVLEYAYALSKDGASPVWSAWTPQIFVDFDNLSSGNYQFQVKLRDKAGNISPTVTRDFSIPALPTPRSPANLRVG